MVVREQSGWARSIGREMGKSGPQRPQPYCNWTKLGSAECLPQPMPRDARDVNQIGGRGVEKYNNQTARTERWRSRTNASCKPHTILVPFLFASLILATTMKNAPANTRTCRSSAYS